MNGLRVYNVGQRRNARKNDTEAKEHADRIIDWKVFVPTVHLTVPWQTGVRRKNRTFAHRHLRRRQFTGPTGYIQIRHADIPKKGGASGWFRIHQTENSLDAPPWAEDIRTSNRNSFDDGNAFAEILPRRVCRGASVFSLDSLVEHGYSAESGM